jgi:uncharacterized protein (DUF1778 family)
MIQQERVRERLSIEVSPEEHKKIKKLAALHGNSIREYVLESIRARIHYESEEKDLFKLMTTINPALIELWDNEKDAAYDEL